jgi:hypothetical protein
MSDFLVNFLQFALKTTSAERGLFNMLFCIPLP